MIEGGGRSGEVANAWFKPDAAHRIQKPLESNHLRAVVIRRSVRQVAEDATDTHGAGVHGRGECLDEGPPL
jgi:hypothetical protein